jgi:ferredoxin
MSKVDPKLAKDIAKYGAVDFSACYNCGNCTAVCSLTEENASFPRMMIRYSMLGMKEEILSSKELWMCYHCGDCSATCPRQADPGELMAGLRRYAIANYEPSGITKLIFKSNPFSILLTLVLATVLGFFLLTLKPEFTVSRWIFSWMPYAVIHLMGLIVFSFTGLTALLGIASMSRRLNRKQNADANKIKKSIFQSIGEVMTEIGTMGRYQKCSTDEGEYWSTKPNLVRPWFVHWSIMWGFIGLLVATILDFLFKDPATTIWLPSRILGSVSGLFLIYGTSLAMFYRITKPTKTYEATKLADWLFLVFLWLAGLTGFWMEVAVSFNLNETLSQVVFMVHTIISMELVILFAFSKFAHAAYRPIALYFLARNRE